MLHKPKQLYIALFLCFCTPIAHAQYSVLVLGIPETEAVEARIQFYANHFRLNPDYHITVSFLDVLPHHRQGMVTLEGEKHIHIRVKKALRLQDLEHTLAHEMVHVKQFIRGELRQGKDGNVAWQGFVYPHPKEIPYRQRGWEKEAFKWESRLIKAYQKKGGEITLPHNKD